MPSNPSSSAPRPTAAPATTGRLAAILTLVAAVTFGTTTTPAQADPNPPAEQVQLVRWVCSEMDLRKPLCDVVQSSLWAAYATADEVFPNQSGADDQRDALRHCVWQGLMTTKMWGNDWLARALGAIHEADAVPDALKGVVSDTTRMDVFNNTVAQRAGHTRTDKQIIAFCIDRAKNAVPITHEQARALDLDNARDYLVYLQPHKAGRARGAA
ncbi:hypothetical protein HII36_26855 [Nonomuraea sp. NN258]|uniref:DUF6973 domain-containing protein n=1 Tax=Nonomuraea antri TaxID=2730852 RepID=UPI001568DED9|nr:hypothetical protein [Nonomuraea antri]NRQ35422.1 hypothetical protein [Nonomuraea antri]